MLIFIMNTSLINPFCHSYERKIRKEITRFIWSLFVILIGKIDFLSFYPLINLQKPFPAFRLFCKSKNRVYAHFFKVKTHNFSISLIFPVFKEKIAKKTLGQNKFK